MPPEVVDMIASNPWTDDAWWENEDFVLMAASIGIRERPKKPLPLQVDSEEDRALAGWTKIAQAFLDMKPAEFDLRESRIQSWLIGFRGFRSRCPYCRQAFNRMEAMQVMADEEETERKRRAREAPEPQTKPKRKKR